MKVLVEMLIKERWKIKCGIEAGEDDSSVSLVEQYMPVIAGERR